MKLLVSAREGQLARSLIERAAGEPDVELVCAGRPEVDLEVPGSLAAAVAALAPDVLVNAAAYTAVDQAEDEPERAFRINADAAGEAAAAARDIGARIIQVDPWNRLEAARGRDPITLLPSTMRASRASPRSKWPPQATPSQVAST